MNQDEQVRQLRKQRRQSFLREIQPYVNYAFRSGLATVLGIVLLVSTAYYAYVFQAESLSYDVRWIAVLLLFPLLVGNPIRTFLKDADLLFLLPAEAAMKRAYFRPSLLAAWNGQVLAISLLWLLLLPLMDRHVDTAQPPWYWIGSWVGLVLYKSLLLYGRWESSRWSRPAWRRLEQLGRWPMAAVALLPLWIPSWKAVALYASMAGLYFVFLRGPDRYSIHWSRLLQEEQRTRARWMHFFSWFVDVDSISGRPERRRWLDPLARLIPFRRESSFSYLYMRVWLRSELWSMLLRLTLVGALTVAVLSSFWWKIGSFIFFSWVTGVQLRALYQHHVHSDWLHVYPLPRGSRERSIGGLILRIHLGILTVFGTILTVSAPYWVWVAIAAIVISWILHRRLMLAPPSDED